MRVCVLILFYTTLDAVVYHKVAGAFHFLEDAYKARDLLVEEYEREHPDSPIRLGYSVEFVEVH